MRVKESHRSFFSWDYTYLGHFESAQNNFEEA